MILPLLLIAPCAVAGVALMAAGLCRARNAAHAMAGALCAAAVAVLAWVAVGYALFGGSGHWMRLAGRSWNWVGDAPVLMRGVELDERALFGMLAVLLAAVIPLGSGAERWRLGAICGSSAILAGLAIPVLAHWSWGGGWLAGLGFVDAGGSGTIHAAAGLAGLAAAWTLGPRRGKFSREGMPAAFPGHNAVLVLLGCLLAWIGWLGMNGAGAMLAGARAVPAVLNTTVSAAAAGLAAAALTRMRFGKTDASLTANGWTAGLVASSAGCAAMPPAGAVVTGAVAGVLIPYAIEVLELRAMVDDPAGAVAVYGVGGLWGLAAAALFGGAAGIAQFVGSATVVGFVLPLMYGVNWAIGRVMGARVRPDAERRGLDLDELGAGAYPDFAGHRDD